VYVQTNTCDHINYIIFLNYYVSCISDLFSISLSLYLSSYLGVDRWIAMEGHGHLLDYGFMVLEFIYQTKKTIKPVYVVYLGSISREKQNTYI